MANNLPTEKKNMAVAMLAEGNSIRSIERMTGVHRDTIMRLGVRVGQGCQQLMDEKFRNLDCSVIEVDEVWGFIGMKQKTANDLPCRPGTWRRVDMDRLGCQNPNWCRRSRWGIVPSGWQTCLWTIWPPASPTACKSLPMRWRPIVEAIERAFGEEVDYGSIVKTFSQSDVNAARRYSPPEVVSVKRVPIMGNPVEKLISTSYVEKQNHTLRMHCRRLSRLTNAFSKKLENFKAAVGLHYAYYNFVKTHTTIRCTPAVEAGVETSAWTVADLVEKVGE